MASAQSMPLPGLTTDRVPTAHWDGRLAVDLFADCGTPALAVFAGWAEAADYPDGGYTVFVTANDGTVAYYAHLAAPRTVGRVQAGQQIGQVSDSGNARGTGCHVHFAVSRGTIGSHGDGDLAPWEWLAGADPALAPALPAIDPLVLAAAAGGGLLLVAALRRRAHRGAPV